MQSSPPPENEPVNNQTDGRNSLGVRINRAANELNPMLMVLAVGLLVLNITLYLGMSVSRAHISGVPAASAATTTGYGQGLSPASLESAAKSGSLAR